MSVAYRSTCRPTIGEPLLVDISTSISVECQSTYRLMLDRYVARYIERHISVDISTDTRPICRPTYRSTLGRYVDRYVDRYVGRGVHKIHMIRQLLHYSGSTGIQVLPYVTKCRICRKNSCKDLSPFVGSRLIGGSRVGSSSLWDSIRKSHDFVVFIDHHVKLR